MKVDLLLTPGEVPDFHTKGRRIVLVDVLRACTSLAIALEAGAERIVPAESVEGAKQLLTLLDRKSTLLAGEMDGEKLPGFDLGNSPREFRDPIVAGKTIIFSSSSGAPLMARMFDVAEKPLLSFVNMEAVAEYLAAAADSEIMVVCAGQEDRFSLEDAVCGGMLCERLASRGIALETNDAAQAALLLYEAHRNDLSSLVRACSYGRFLSGLGMDADLEEAARVDSVRLVPVVREGRVTTARPPWGASAVQAPAAAPARKAPRKVT